MAPKYECPKCGRRFTEWGAEKLGFKCPGDEWTTHAGEEEVELVRVGSSTEETSHRRPSLKRSRKRAKAPAAAPVIEEDEALAADVEELEDDDEAVDDDDEGTDADDSVDTDGDDSGDSDDEDSAGGDDSDDDELDGDDDDDDDDDWEE